MRTYPINSSHAAGRILALTLISDGNLAPEELETLGRSRILQYVSLDELQFRQVLEDLCNDLLTSSVKQGHVELEPATIDSLLAEVTEPDLRRRLLRAMWAIADADGVLADAEATLLARACAMWSAESRFIKESAGA